jgi:hypothetical protein
MAGLAVFKRTQCGIVALLSIHVFPDGIFAKYEHDDHFAAYCTRAISFQSCSSLLFQSLGIPSLETLQQRGLHVTAVTHSRPIEIELQRARTHLAVSKRGACAR